jgi:UDP-2,3-diacylglucosamine pyrophosphatase LpxH
MNLIKTKLDVKTLILSDIHLGMPESKAAQAAHLIRNTTCQKLILNGDIIDGWHLHSKGGWTRTHTHFVRTILKKLDKEDTEIIYIQGNHDDILSTFLPVQLDQFQILQNYTLHTTQGPYLVIHGDGFDHITTNYKWIAVLGGIGYNWLLKINRGYNQLRRFLGKENFSLSRWVKLKVKTAISHVGKYELQLKKYAESKNFKGIICGHIHYPANKWIDQIHYLNSGDWVESMTAIIEQHDGTFQIISYHDFCETTNRQPKGDDKSLDLTLVKAHNKPDF